MKITDESWHYDANGAVRAMSGAIVCRADFETARYIARIQNEEQARRQAEKTRHPYEDIPSMAKFVMSSGCDDHYAFMRLWIHGEWEALDREFPEWKMFLAGDKKAA